jgi:hypothetical protein
MHPDKDWLARIEVAAKALEVASAAPAWLALAVRQSQTFAGALAPVRTAAPPRSDFFYPH